MSGHLPDQQDRILQKLLIDLGLATDGENNPLQAWPCFVGLMPDDDSIPDNCITATATAGRPHGKVATGLNFEKFGVQLKFRSAGPSDGFVKASVVLRDLCLVRNMTVSIAQTAGTATNNYNIQGVMPNGTVVRLGPDQTNRTYSWSLNLLMTIQPT